MKNFTILIVLLNLQSIFAQNDKVYIYEALNFGNGYNSVTQQEYLGVMNYENVLKSTEIIANATGSKGFLEFEEITDKYHLKNSLNITTKIDLDIKYGGFSSSNTYKKMLFRETEINKFKQVGIVKAQYENIPYVLLNPSVKRKLLKLAKRNPNEFLRTCGDMFVSKIYSGGELFAIFDFESRDESQKEKVTNFFKSTNKYLGNKLSVEREEIKESFKKLEKTKKKILVYSAGGSEPIKLNSFDGFLDSIEQFKAQVTADKSPTILYVELTPYENIPNFPKNVNFDKIRIEQRNFIDLAYNLSSKLDESISNANFIIENPEFFYKEDFLTANEKLLDLGDLLEELNELIRLANKDFDNCKISLLDKYNEIDIFFEPIKFPNIEVVEKLDFKVSNNWKKVFDVTSAQKNYLFRIEGNLVAKDRFSQENYSDFDIYQKFSSRYIKRKFGYSLHLQSQTPHYQIRITNTSNGNVLNEFIWKGTPISARPNSTISVRLVNHKSRYYIKDHKGRFYKWADRYRGNKDPRFKSESIVYVDGDIKFAPVAILAPINQSEQEIRILRNKLFEGKRGSINLIENNELNSFNIRPIKVEESNFITYPYEN